MPDGSYFNTGAGFTRKQKAALLVQVLIRDGHAPELSEMPEAVQLSLTREIAAIGAVDKATVDAVITEFLDEMDQLGLTGPGDISAALSALSGRLSPDASAKLKDEVTGGDPWPLVVDLPVEVQLALMHREAVEVCAITLSKLPVTKAAEILGRLQGDRARHIAYAMSLTGDVSPAVVKRIGAALVKDYARVDAPAFRQTPPLRLGAILTSSQAATRDTLLAGIGDDDAAFADEVRRAIFTFADLPARLSAPDVPKVIRGIDQVQLVAALVHATAVGGVLENAVDHLLSNLSQRMADQLREEMAERGTVKPSIGEAAQSDVIAAVRALADAGEITLFSADDEG